MRRLLVPFRLTGEPVTLTGQLAHRVRHVLRAGVGDRVVLFDPFGNEWLAEVVGWEGKGVQVQLVERKEQDRERKVAITLFQGLPKGDKMDFIIQKATELGVERIVPMVTRRTVVHLNPERAAQKRTRWHRVAAAATEQSGGRFVPEISLPLPFNQAVQEAAQADQWLLFYEAAEIPLRERLRGSATPRRVAIMVGPEGGFDPEEVALAQKHGAVVVGLGQRILRTETAALVAVALVLYELDSL